MMVTILGGKEEIGGNKILIEHKGTKIFLDFGMSFNQNSKYFSEFLNPRKCTALTDYLEMGLLPDLKGIYREDYLKHMDRAVEERDLDAVFLSHAHADHAKYIHFLRFDIPIYCTEATKIILQTLESTGTGTVSDLTSACEAYSYYENKKGTMSRVTVKQTDFIHKRKFHIMEPEKRVQVGCLEIEMLPVDHSLPGACGFIIYSDEGNMVYTGDIRFHGYNRDKSERFIEKAIESKPKWLLCEGTRIDNNTVDSEENVKNEIGRIINESKGSLVFVEHPIRDTDRVRSIYEASISSGREFVIGLKLAYLIEALGDLSPFSTDDVKILVPKKSWGLIGKDMDHSLIEKDYLMWERDFVFRPNAITTEEIQKDPGKYLVSMNMWIINQLTDIKPENAVWIKSSCEPFSEEMNIDEERKKNWLTHFGIKSFSVHASGHASGDEIRDIIKKINPEHLIPLHTEHPEMFCKKED